MRCLFQSTDLVPSKEWKHSLLSVTFVSSVQVNIFSNISQSMTLKYFLEYWGKDIKEMFNLEETMKLCIVSISVVFYLQTATWWKLSHSPNYYSTAVLQHRGSGLFAFQQQKFPLHWTQVKSRLTFYTSQLWNAYLKLCCIFRQLQNLLLQPVGVHAIPNNLNKTQSV